MLHAIIVGLNLPYVDLLFARDIFRNTDNKANTKNSHHWLSIEKSLTEFQNHVAIENSTQTTHVLLFEKKMR